MDPVRRGAHGPGVSVFGSPFLALSIKFSIDPYVAMQYRWKSRSFEVKKFIIAFVNTLTKNYSRILRSLAWIFPEVSQSFYFLGNTSSITWCTPASPWSLARRRLSFSPPGGGQAAVPPALASVRRQWWSQRCTLSYSSSQSRGLRNSEILKPLAHTDWLRKWNMAVFRKESVKASDRRYFFSVQRRWHG